MGLIRDDYVYRLRSPSFYLLSFKRFTLKGGVRRRKKKRKGFREGVGTDDATTPLKHLFKNAR